MLLTITTTYRPATDLGYLLRKNPARPQSFSLSFGKAHVFYPEATPERCTVALLVEVDPIGLVRNRRGPAGVTHRLSIEIVPGVFGGEILGTYMPRTGLVSVYAFVYALRNLPLPRMLCEFYLR